MIDGYIDTLSYIGRKTVILIGTMGGFALGVATTLTEDHIALIILIVSGMTAVVGGLTWIDARIEKKIRESRHDTNLKLQYLLAQIESSHNLIAQKIGISPLHSTPNAMTDDSRP